MFGFCFRFRVTGGHSTGEQYIRILRVLRVLRPLKAIQRVKKLKVNLLYFLFDKLNT